MRAATLSCAAATLFACASQTASSRGSGSDAPGGLRMEEHMVPAKDPGIQLYLRNKEMLATLSTLVVDPANQTLRKNASSKARRLDEVLAQFDCTWDLGFIAKDLHTCFWIAAVTSMRDADHSGAGCVVHSDRGEAINLCLE